MLGSVSFLVAAALIPPLVLLAVVYRMDKLEKEPARLLWSLFFRGLLGMFPILLLELAADQFIDFFPWDPITYLFLAYFVVPGFIEEGVKNRVLRKRTWHDPNFNDRFDGIVYGVFVSWALPGWRTCCMCWTPASTRRWSGRSFPSPAMPCSAWLWAFTSPGRNGPRNTASVTGCGRPCAGLFWFRRCCMGCMTFCSWGLKRSFMSTSRGW